MYFKGVNIIDAPAAAPKAYFIRRNIIIKRGKSFKGKLLNRRY